MELQNRKIVILGAGHVGSHAGYSLIAQGLAEEIVYIDIDQRKAEAQALDLFDATNYLPSRAKVRAGTYADAKDAQLLIVAVGPLPDMSKGQTRMDTLHQTIPILKDVVESIRTSGFSGIILSISNPADVMVHYIQSQLNWPSRKILSTSTTLDSARLRRAIAEATGVDQKSISAYALGEHGESQMVAARKPAGPSWGARAPQSLALPPPSPKWSGPFSTMRTGSYRCPSCWTGSMDSTMCTPVFRLF